MLHIPGDLVSTDKGRSDIVLTPGIGEEINLTGEGTWNYEGRECYKDSRELHSCYGLGLVRVVVSEVRNLVYLDTASAEYALIVPLSSHIGINLGPSSPWSPPRLCKIVV